MLRKCFLIAFLVMFVAIQTALGGYYIHNTQISPSTSIGIGDSVTITVEIGGDCCHDFLYCTYQAPIELYVNSIKVQQSTISQTFSYCDPGSWWWGVFPCRGSFTYTPPAPGTYNLAVRTYCPLDGTSSWSNTYTVTVQSRVINLAV
ncbi:MAG: hypothetical protein RMH75_07040, partial [Archaeoglobaceae archaeon]|nr:hypothetical protein [Archaeoglobaceae archaeon]